MIPNIRVYEKQGVNKSPITVWKKPTRQYLFCFHVLWTSDEDTGRAKSNDALFNVTHTLIASKEAWQAYRLAKVWDLGLSWR